MAYVELEVVFAMKHVAAELAHRSDWQVACVQFICDIESQDFRPSSCFGDDLIESSCRSQN